jgi:hypothetical protein
VGMEGFRGLGEEGSVKGIRGLFAFVVC